MATTLPGLNMARRQVRWAKTALHRLKIALGARCNRCGSVVDLQFDCIVPQGHKHHSVGLTARACFYRKMARLGNLQLLCERCHVSKTADDLGYSKGIISERITVLCPVNSVNNNASPYETTNNTKKDGEQVCEPF